MKKVFKYKLERVQLTHSLPCGMEVRHVGLDMSGDPCVWVEVDADADHGNIDVTFTVYGTGHAINERDENYAGSFMQHDTFMWHVYWRTGP